MPRDVEIDDRFPDARVELPRLARGSSANIMPLVAAELDTAAFDVGHDAAPMVAAVDADAYVRVALEISAEGGDALSTWNAMCRVEQMLRERRGS